MFDLSSEYNVFAAAHRVSQILRRLRSSFLAAPSPSGLLFGYARRPGGGWLRNSFLAAPPPPAFGSLAGFGWRPCHRPIAGHHQPAAGQLRWRQWALASLAVGSANCRGIRRPHSGRFEARLLATLFTARRVGVCSCGTVRFAGEQARETRSSLPFLRSPAGPFGWLGARSTSPFCYGVSRCSTNSATQS